MLTTFQSKRRSLTCNCLTLDSGVTSLLEMQPRPLQCGEDEGGDLAILTPGSRPSSRGALPPRYPPSPPAAPPGSSPHRLSRDHRDQVFPGAPRCSRGSGSSLPRSCQVRRGDHGERGRRSG